MKVLRFEPAAFTAAVGLRNSEIIFAAGNGQVARLKQLFANRKNKNEEPLEPGITDNIISNTFTRFPNLSVDVQNQVVAVFIANNSAGYKPYLLNRDADFARMKRLIESCGANININHEGWTALHSAYFRPDGQEVCEYLIAHGADINIPETLMGYGTILHIAIANETFEIAIRMIELCRKHNRKINYNARDNKGSKTLLITATQVMSLKMVQEILKDGQSHVNAVDAEGRTALHIACALGQVDIVNALITAGASITQCDNNGKAALDYATSHETVVRKLLQDVSIDPDRDCGSIRNSFYTGNFQPVTLPKQSLNNKEIKTTCCMSSKTNADTCVEVLSSSENISAMNKIYLSYNKTDQESINKQISQLQGKTLIAQCVEGRKNVMVSLVKQTINLRQQNTMPSLSAADKDNLLKCDLTYLKSKLNKVNIDPKSASPHYPVDLKYNFKCK